jgi:hypothetical protein
MPIQDITLIDGDSSSGASGDSSFRLKKANIVYVVIFLFAAVLCFVLYNTCPRWLGRVVSTAHDADADDTDLAITLVARTSAAAALFFLVHAVALICNPNLADSCQFIFHVSWPGLHFFLFLGAYALFLFAVPDGFFDAYLWFAYGGAAIYLVMQIIFLIDFFYYVNEWLNEGERNGCLWFGTITLNVLALTGYVLGFVFYHESTQSTAVLGVNLGVSVLLSIMAVRFEHASIFTAALVSAYVAFLTFSGCMSAKAIGPTDVVVSIVFASIMLLWVGYSAFSTTQQFGTACTCGEERQFSLSFFHGVFALGSVYMTMLATNWARQDADEWSLGQGKASMWANWISSWFSLLLFLWTMIAPLVLPDREF